MIFQDKKGKLLMPEEVDELSQWEIEEKEIHVCEDYHLSAKMDYQSILFIKRN